MFFYNNFCFSSVASRLFLFLVLTYFSAIINNTFHLSIIFYLSNPTAVVIAHRNFTSTCSNVAVPIACDASNAQTVAVREYHYLTEQVIAVKGYKPFTGTQIRIARFCREKVMAYLLQRLTVCQRYWITLFSFQRTGKEEIFFSLNIRTTNTNL